MESQKKNFCLPSDDGTGNNDNKDIYREAYLSPDGKMV